MAGFILKEHVDANDGRERDPKYFLQVENRRRNVFVTQLGELR